MEILSILNFVDLHSQLSLPGGARMYTNYCICFYHGLVGAWFKTLVLERCFIIPMHPKFSVPNRMGSISSPTWLWVLYPQNKKSW